MLEKERGGAERIDPNKPVKTPAPTPQKPAWQSTNFIVTVVLFLGGMFVGFPDTEAGNLVRLFVQLTAGILMFRNFFKTAKLDLKAWIGNANTLNYLYTILVTLAPGVDSSIIGHVVELIKAAMGGNWQGILVALGSIATWLYYFFKNRKGTAEAK